MKIKPVPGTLNSQLNTIFIDVFEKHPKYKQPCRRYSGWGSSFVCLKSCLSFAVG